jgi:hypothetical protein
MSSHDSDHPMNKGDSVPKSDHDMPHKLKRQTPPTTTRTTSGDTSDTTMTTMNEKTVSNKKTKPSPFLYPRHDVAGTDDSADQKSFRPPVPVATTTAAMSSWPVRSSNSTKDNHEHPRSTTKGDGGDCATGNDPTPHRILTSDREVDFARIRNGSLSRAVHFVDPPIIFFLLLLVLLLLFDHDDHEKKP